MLKMFQLLGLGEKSGSGMPKILRAWREQSWLTPLVSEKLDLDMTLMTLPIISMIPEEIDQEIKAIVAMLTVTCLSLIELFWFSAPF